MAKTKILLISSPTSTEKQVVDIDNYFPGGILSIGTYLQKKDIEVKVLDLKTKWENYTSKQDSVEEFIRKLITPIFEEFKPDIIGIGCFFSGTFQNLLKMANEIKAVSNIPIAIGGIHPTLFAEQILMKYPNIDFVIIGEGELSFYELIKFIQSGDELILENMDGIAYRKDNKIILKPKTKFIADLDEIPNVNYGLLDLKDCNVDTSNWYSPKNIKVGQPFPIITSRGCPNKCTFCSNLKVHGNQIRFRSADKVLNEISFLYEKYNVRYIHFMDDNLTFNGELVRKIFQGIIDRDLNLQFDTPNGVSVRTLNEPLIDLMVKAGLIKISLAIESGSDYIRNKCMKKRLSKQKIIDVVKIIRKYPNVFIVGFFMIGMPEETHETLQDTFDLIKELNLDKFGIFFATPYPGTQLFNQCMNDGLIKVELKQIMDCSYLHGGDMPHFAPYKLKKEDLIKFRQKAHNYLAKKRAEVDLPNNYPLKYKKS